MATKIQLRRDTAANWNSENPGLAQGEIGIELDSNKIKIGNGVNLWNDLPYFSSDSGNAGTAGFALQAADSYLLEGYTVAQILAMVPPAPPSDYASTAGFAFNSADSYLLEGNTIQDILDQIVFPTAVDYASTAGYALDYDKTYIDDQDQQVLIDANDYTDQEISAITYFDKSVNYASTAGYALDYDKTYIDQQDAQVLINANDYTDQEISAITYFDKSVNYAATSGFALDSALLEGNTVQDIIDMVPSGGGFDGTAAWALDVTYNLSGDRNFQNNISIEGQAYVIQTSVGYGTNGANIIWDLDNNANLQLNFAETGNINLSVINAVAGGTYVLETIQSNSGSSGINWSADFAFSYAYDIPLSVGSLEKDLMTFYYDGDHMINMSMLKNIQPL